MLIEISFVPLLSDAITVKVSGTHSLPWPFKFAQMACTTDLEGDPFCPSFLLPFLLSPSFWESDH